MAISKNPADIKLNKNYNSWWEGKKIVVAKTDVVKTFYRDLLDSLLAYHPQKKKPKLLDFACGTGELLVEAKDKGFDLYGIDISDYAIKKAKELVDAKLYVGSGEKLPFKNNEFDYSICIGSLEHFTHPDKGVAETARVLKKDGIALIHVPNLMFLGHIYMTYRYGVMPSEGGQMFSEVFYTYEGWKKLFEDNGLKVINCTVYNDVSKTKKVNFLTNFLWHTFFKGFVPFNLSYAFNFYCKKK